MGTLSDGQMALLTDYDKDSAYSEAFRTVYANIRLHWDTTEKQQYMLLLTTPATYVGQSAATAKVAANLAIVAAQSGTPILLVDANLRSPSIEQRFGLSKQTQVGLSDLLLEESISSQKIATYLQTTFVSGLRLLGAGISTEQGPSLLLSPKLPEVVTSISQFLAETETQPSIVLFNSPAVLVGADASLIAALVDQTALAIAVGRTTRTQAKQAQEQLQQVHAKLGGVILLQR